MDCFFSSKLFVYQGLLPHKVLGCERTGSDNASDKRQNCRLSCRVKLSLRKINGNRRKCTHRTRATSDKIFQTTSDKILNFYNFMRALLRQATILSLVTRVVAPCEFTPLEG